MFIYVLEKRRPGDIVQSLLVLSGVQDRIKTRAAQAHVAYTSVGRDEVGSGVQPKLSNHHLSDS